MVSGQDLEKSLSNLSARSVDQIHRNADVDQSRAALHHTLGKRPNQAAPGNELEMLRESVERGRGGVDDKGWTNLSQDSGSGTARWCCYNGVVEIVVSLSAGTYAGSSTGTVAASGIPGEYRPVGGRYGAANFGGENSGLGVINSLGQIVALPGASRTTFRFSKTYRIG